MPKVLLTGATGFLGSHLLPLLLREGFSVVALLREPNALPDIPNVERKAGDICDFQSVLAAAEGCEGFFHCAGLVSRKPEDAEAMWKANYVGTRESLLAAKQAGLRRCIVASTSGTVAIRKTAKPVPSEESDTPYDLIGQWPYYRSKLYAEEEAFRIGRKDAEGRGLDVICVLPSILFGPGDLRSSSTEDIRLFLEEKIPAIPSGGLSFVDVRDVATAMLAAYFQGQPGQRYLLGSTNLSFADFFAKLSRLSDTPAPWLWMPKHRTLADLGQKAFSSLLQLAGKTLAVDETSHAMSQYFWYLDDTLARETLGFTSRDPMETLRDTIQDLRDRGIVWPKAPSFPPKRA